MVKPETEFAIALRRVLPLTDSGPVAFTDLPEEEGRLRIGGFLLSWENEPLAASQQ